MQTYFPNLPNEIELFALCVNSIIGIDSGNDMVNSGHCYKVVRFVDEHGFFPYGVRVSDYMGNELNQTFHTQRFLYFETVLN